MTVAEKLITADELSRMGDIGRCEILYGELIMMSPAGLEHGDVALRIGRLLAEYVETHRLGRAFGAETGFLLERGPDLLLAPDASFLRQARIAGRLPKGFFDGAPDIAVEVVSPCDSHRKVQEKVNTWLAHGTVSVWVADPANMTITLHRTGLLAQRSAPGEDFVDETGLPGFSMSVNKVFLLP